MPATEDRRLALYHERTRRRGVNPFLYWFLRPLVQPSIHLYFRLRRTGCRNIPTYGPVILAANHRSFLDPFVVACCLRRPIYFVAKNELFRNRFVGWLLNSLGAFPIRRGESDEASVETALALLERGEAVVIFPEGTRTTRARCALPSAASVGSRCRAARPSCRSRSPAPGALGEAGGSAPCGSPSAAAGR